MVYDLVTRIQETYFLSVAAPTFVDANGGRWCNELWAKDLAIHLDYIENLTLAGPCELKEPNMFDTSLDREPFNRIQYIDLPSPKSHFDALLKLPKLFGGILRGVRSCELVHTGFGLWPVSEGWIAVPLGKLFGRFVITNVESSFWRSKSSTSRIRRVRGALIESINRFCVKIADLRLFTSLSYAEQFLGESYTRAYVVPATWIDTDDILDAQEAIKSWESKSGCVKLLFAGRLIADKGVWILIDALRTAAKQQKALLEITIIGSGELWPVCVDISNEVQGSSVVVRLLGPVNYGRDFSDLLRKFDAVVVPSLSDEQPRLIFDAFSQAVPVIGSDTGGIRQVVKSQENGILFKAGDANALAAVMDWAGANRSALRDMGISALKGCDQFTHLAMHEARSRILNEEIKRFRLRNPKSE